MDPISWFCKGKVKGMERGRHMRGCRPSDQVMLVCLAQCSSCGGRPVACGTRQESWEARADM